MKIYISVDMEGVCGISSWVDLKQNKQWANMRATAEVNAAISGIYERAEEEVEEICVNDGHGTGANLIIEKLDWTAKVIRGYPRPLSMMEGIDQKYDLLFLLGYHSRIGTAFGPMCHSYSPDVFYQIDVNGEPWGEMEINASLAAYFGAPLGMVTGDDQLIEQVRRRYGDEPETVITKWGISHGSVKTRHPDDVNSEIREKAGAVVEKAKFLHPVPCQEPVNATLTLVNTAVADYAALLPMVSRTDGRRMEIYAPDYYTFYRTLMAIRAIFRAERVLQEHPEQGRKA